MNPVQLLRNPEVRRAVCAHLALGAGLLLAARLAGAPLWIPLTACAAYTALYIGLTCRQYRRIAALAADVDRILHGQKVVNLEEYAEGELSILQTEIHKMTVRLGEQQLALQKDKAQLADAIADISHQIRTPLTSVHLLTTMLSEPGLSDERRRELSHRLLTMLSRMEWLIEALLKMSKLEAGTVSLRRETLPAEELLRRAAGPLLISMELREQTLRIQAQGSFTGDAAWTSEAIGNILKNCMEHTPQGGRIDAAAAENALYTEIVIADTGSGIDPEDLPHIFERFYKGKNSDEHSFGIGLALAREIAAAQNGSIRAENRPEGGARFILRFYKGTV